MNNICNKQQISIIAFYNFELPYKKLRQKNNEY
jgi:hypothetical protein